MRLFCGRSAFPPPRNKICPRKWAFFVPFLQKTTANPSLPASRQAQILSVLLSPPPASGGHRAIFSCPPSPPPFFVRPGELRHADWSELNIERQEWRVPSAKMNARILNIVPLSTQALSNLENELGPLVIEDRCKSGKVLSKADLITIQKDTSENSR